MRTASGPKGLLTLALILRMLTASAQSYSSYTSITTANGLPSNYVFAVCADAKGFLWAGTDKGLCRYDGFRWQVWDRDNGLPGNYVTRVYSDGRGGLWLNIDEHGLYHFRDGRLQQLPLSASVNMTTLQVSPQGELYIAGVMADNKSFGCFLFNGANPTQPTAIMQSSPFQNKVWANASTKKIYLLHADAAAVAKFKQEARAAWPVVVLPLPPHMIEGTSLQHVSDSVIITNTHYYRLSPKGTVDISGRLFADGNQYAFNLATASGIYVYDIKTGYWFIGYTGERRFYNTASGLGSNYVNQVYQTADGTLVVATLGAGLQLSKGGYRKTFSTGNSLVRTVLPSADGWLLLAGEGLLSFNNGDEHLQHCGTVPASATSLCRKGDELAIGTLRGLSLYKASGNAFTPTRNLEFNAGVSAVVPSGTGFLTGTYGSGVVRFSTVPFASEPLAYPLRVAENLLPLPNGYAALSYEKGVFITDTVLNQTVQLNKATGLLSNSVHAVYHRRDSLWIGTKSGINLCVQSKVVATLAFPSSTEKALCIFHDRKGRLWVVSDAALYLREGVGLRRLGSHAVVEGDDVLSAAAYNAQTGQLGIGTSKAFLVIDVDAVAPYTAVAPPQLIAAFLDGKQEADSVFTVPYQFQHLRFAVAPSSASLLLRPSFFYRLEGRDENWIAVKDSLVITLSALRPGSYRLWMKTVNADGFETVPKRMAGFTVQRPWWQGWPFLLSCFVATAAASVASAKNIERGRRRRREAKLALQQSLQAERERISKDLHDHLGANLATIIAQTDNIEARLHTGDVATASNTVQHLSAQSRETMNVLRETIWAVQEAEHTLDEFAMRMRSFLQRAFESTAIVWEVKNGVQNTVVLSPTQTLHLFRIVQEATQNILKHAGATKAEYAFSREGTALRLRISDNGRGFGTTTAAKTNGLLNMTERAKTLGGNLAVSNGVGITLTITVPL